MLTFKKLQNVFTALGAEMVIEMSMFTGLSLELAYQEFRDKFIQGEKYQSYL